MDQMAFRNKAKSELNVFAMCSLPVPDIILGISWRKRIRATGRETDRMRLSVICS